MATSDTIHSAYYFVLYIYTFFLSMSSSCLKSYPHHIQIIKLIQKNSLLFESLLLNKYEYFQRILSNINKYLMQYGKISSQIYTYLSQFIKELNNYLKNLTKNLYEIDCLIMKCSIWLKNYKKKSLQIDSIEQEHMKIFFQSLHLFSSIISLNNEKTPNIIEKSISNFEIKSIENYSNENNPNKYVHESNLTWSFVTADMKENLMVRKEKDRTSVIVLYSRRKICI